MVLRGRRKFGSIFCPSLAVLLFVVLGFPSLLRATPTVYGQKAIKNCYSPTETITKKETMTKIGTTEYLVMIQHKPSSSKSLMSEKSED